MMDEIEKIIHDAWEYNNGCSGYNSEKLMDGMLRLFSKERLKIKELERQNGIMKEALLKVIEKAPHSTLCRIKKNGKLKNTKCSCGTNKFISIKAAREAIKSCDKNGEGE